MKRKVFISYRREGGSELARLVRASLLERGYLEDEVFMDVEDLRSGPFNTALFKEIQYSTDFVVILTPGCLERCVNENDWLRLEIACAIKLKKNIVPIRHRSFVEPAAPLPPDLKGLLQFQGVESSHEYFSASMDKLVKLLSGGRATRSRSKNKGMVLAGLGLVLLGLIVLDWWWLHTLNAQSAGEVESASVQSTDADATPTVTATPTPEPLPRLAWIDGPKSGDHVRDKTIRVAWRIENSVIAEGFLWGFDDPNPRLKITDVDKVFDVGEPGEHTITIIPLGLRGVRGEPLSLSFTYQPNRAPALTAGLGDNPIQQGQAGRLIASATDPDGDEVSLEARLDRGAWTPVEGGEAALTDLGVGIHAIEVRATDNQGLTAPMWEGTLQVRPQPTRTPTQTPTPTLTPTPAPIPTASVPTMQTGTTTVEDLGGGVGLEMVWIGPGSFMLGSPEGEADRSTDEGPHHRVELDGFWLAKQEVTQEQWLRIMGSNPSYFRGDKRLPVEGVQWEEAMEFCRKASLLTGKRYTLPTEAQWEYACRAGTTSPFNTGLTISTTEANYNGNRDYANGRMGENREKTVPVRSFAPNAWGLFDMHGNVMEWCLDWYGENAYATSSTNNPTGPATGQVHVLRGGSWIVQPRQLRSAARNRIEPAYRSGNFGFRPACIP
jgi:formylglycine-generating enzyme required for sulfatase activity